MPAETRVKTTPACPQVAAIFHYEICKCADGRLSCFEIYQSVTQEKGSHCKIKICTRVEEEKTEPIVRITKLNSSLFHLQTSLSLQLSVHEPLHCAGSLMFYYVCLLYFGSLMFYMTSAYLCPCWLNLRVQYRRNT